MCKTSAGILPTRDVTDDTWASPLRFRTPLMLSPKPKQLKLDTGSPLPGYPSLWPSKLSSVSLNLLLPYVVLRYENKYLCHTDSRSQCVHVCVRVFVCPTL